MRVLITGARGQLGWELERTAPEGGPNSINLIAADANGSRLDITDSAAVEHYVRRQTPDLIINSAAYTAVDAAERNEALAFSVNGAGAANLAKAAKTAGCRIIHMSTDFVFDGQNESPYSPDDEPNPVGVYGCSKLAGEQAVLESGADAVVIRTSWLYSVHGGNFVKTMLRLMGEKDEIKVVDDQRGSPTWGRGLADAIWRVAVKPEIQGVLHWCDAGVISWFEFAQGIQQEALALGLLDRAARLSAVSTAEYPTAARRPAYSALDASGATAALGLVQRPWRDGLHDMLVELKNMNPA